MTQPVQEPSQGRTDQGQEFRTRQLFRRPAPSPATPATTASVPIIGYTAVQSVLTSPAKWPGGMKVVPAYGYNVVGSESADQGYAHRQVAYDQTAANYAAAADVVVGTPEDWLLDVSVMYQCWVGVKVASNPATANIGIDSTATGTNEINLTGTPSDNYALYRLFAGETFAAGETITVKSYRTSSSGDVKIDQLYFFPSNNGAYFVGPTNQMQACLAAIEISTFANLGPTASTGADSRFSGNVVKDTQQVDDFKDATVSAWGFLTNPSLGYVSDLVYLDQNMRIPRHNYVTACYESTTDNNYWEGQFVSLSGDGIPISSARSHLTSAGFFYLGQSSPYGAPPQLTLWRNNAVGGTGVPYLDDAAPDSTDVRVGEYFAPSSFFDDY